MAHIIPTSTTSSLLTLKKDSSLTVLVGNIPTKATELSLRQFLHGTLMQRGFCGVDHVPLGKITILEHEHENDERAALVECTTQIDRASTLQLHLTAFQDNTLRIEPAPEQAPPTSNASLSGSSCNDPGRNVDYSLVTKEQLQLQVQELQNELAKTRIDLEMTCAELNERAAAQLTLQQELDTTRAKLQEARREWQVEQMTSQDLQKRVETQIAVEEIVLGETRQEFFAEQEAKVELQQQLVAMELQTEKDGIANEETITALHDTRQELKEEKEATHQLQDRVMAQQHLLAEAGEQIIHETEHKINLLTLNLQQSSKLQTDSTTPGGMALETKS
jgi:hypothetical protein